MIESPITRPLAALLLMLSVALAAGCSGAASRPVGAPTGGRSAGERADRPTSAGSVAHLEERALLLLLADRRTYEPLVVRRSLAGPPDLREDLAVALGRAGDPRGLDPLLGLLLDDAPAVRRAAAFALGELGERLPEARIEARRRAAAALLDAASAPDREVGVLAVEALGKLAVTLGTVSGRLDELPAEERAARLLPSLHRYPDPRMPDVAARALASGDPELRRWAVYALARHPMPESLPTLRALAREVAAVLEEDAGGGDARIAVWVARGLAAAGGASGGEAGGEAARDLELLRPFLDWPGRSPSDGADPVIAALRAARTLIGDGRAAAPADWRDRLAELLDDPRPGVRLTAVDAASVWLLDPRLGD
ncbi:MAG: HEAT repeat domain-containing protein, partial [Acidobacteriota bacterium]